MTQLPPKTPSSCPSFFPSAAAAHPITLSHWSLADELFDYSASHRRTISHSGATFDPLAAANSTMALSTPSDHYSSVNADNKPSFNPPSSSDQPNWSVRRDLSEEESSCKLDLSATTTVLDAKRLKRILANRQSARRSRVRKLQYIADLEKSVATLQTEVLALSPRVALLDRQRSILVAGNSHLKQRIAALAQDKIFKDGHQASLKKEIERLKLIYQQQKLRKMAAMTTIIDAGGDDAAAIVVQSELQGRVLEKPLRHFCS